MSFQLTTTLSEALQAIDFTGEQSGEQLGEQQKVHHFPIQEAEQSRTDEVLNRYGEAKWAIIDLLNEHYKHHKGDNNNPQQNFDLYNWLLENKEDEVAYFLNEAGSNCLTHSQYRAPSQFRLWLGKKGFVIGIEQKGKGFNVEKALAAAGGFFNFFEKSKSVVFFDDLNEARNVLMMWTF